MSRALLAVVLLAATYAFALASADPLDLLFGAGLATALVALFRRFLAGEVAPGRPSLLRRMIAFVPFAGAVILDIITGTWAVILVVLGLRPLRRPGIVAVPLGARTPLGVAVSAMATTLSPGSYLIDVDWERRVMLLHMLDASDPAAVVAAHQRFYEWYQWRVFP